MSKGVSPVIASILLVLVTISLGAGYLVFTGRLAQETTETAEEQITEARELTSSTFTIDSVRDRRVFVRNTGRQAIDVQSLALTIDDEDATYEQNEQIEPGEIGTLAVTDLWKSGPGERELRLAGTVSSASKTVRIKPNEGTVLDLRFEEGSGNTANDFSGNENNGDLGEGDVSKTPQRTPAKMGNGLRFDGVNDYIVVPDSATLRTKTFTAAFWVKPDSSPVQGLLGKDESVFHWRVFADNATWEFDALDPETANLRSTAGFMGGQWAHLEISYDGNAASLYVNGVLENTTTGISDMGGMNAADIRIGVTYTNYFAGTLDEILIYDRAYEPEELYVMEES